LTLNTELVEAARIIEALTGIPPIIPLKTKKEKQEQAARVRRFLALPPELQEGALEYAENMKKAYLSKKY
jgi:hypothetical protein